MVENVGIRIGEASPPPFLEGGVIALGRKINRVQALQLLLLSLNVVYVRRRTCVSRGEGWIVVRLFEPRASYSDHISSD
jgi:hypothetical protein